MNVAIVGAGIMGRLLASSFYHVGCRISIFEKQAKMECQNSSYAAAGLLTPVAELEKSEPIIFDLGRDSLKNHWPQIIKKLISRQSDPIYFQHNGSLLLTHPHDKAEMHRVISIIESKLNEKSLYQRLDQNQLTQLEPELAQFHEGYYFSDEGQIDNQSLLSSLHSFLTNDKITWYTSAHVQHVAPQKITIDNVEKNFDLVVDCRGLGAKSLFANLRGVRGELIWLHAPDVNLQRPIRLIHPRYNLYIAPRPQHHYILGASEIESEDEGPITVRSMMELLSAAYYVHPGFSEAKIIKTATHCRPTLSDHLPKIKYIDGLIAVNGLYRHGFLIAPAIADEIIRYLSQGLKSLNYPSLWEQFNDNYSF